MKWARDGSIEAAPNTTILLHYNASRLISSISHRWCSLVTLVAIYVVSVLDPKIDSIISLVDSCEDIAVLMKIAAALFGELVGYQFEPSGDLRRH